MKFRKGFVSNSSSSSFIVSRKDYSSVFDLAKQMIPFRKWDTDADLIKKIELAEIEGLDVNTSICFNSCNYDTYIVEYKNYYLVSTCNNHYWKINSIHTIPKSVKDLLPEDDTVVSSFEYLEEIVPKLSSFWYPEYDLGGRPLSVDIFCKRHFVNLIKSNGDDNPICPICHFEKKSK